MRGVGRSATLGLVSDRAALDEAPATVLPLWWWARGLNLRERIDTPRPPAADRVGRGIRSGLWSLGDRAGFAARLADMALSDDLASALGDELPERLGARAAKPGWAHYIELAVAAAGEEPPEKSEACDGTGSPAEGAEVFLPALRPLIAPAWAAVASRIALPEAELGAVRSGFETRLGDQLARQSARTLVRELSRERAAGRLIGATAQERFAAFTASLGTRQGLALLFTRYPVLGRMLGQTAVYAVEAMVELADRLHTDRGRLAAELFGGADPGVLTRLELGCGDPHQGNRSVAILHFAAGSAVYKPRPLDQHALLDEAADWLNSKVAGLGLRTPRTVRGDGYGWLEFIEHRLCESVTEADRFYWREGALLALLYTIDGTDVHYENLIACGDQPVLVDAETLLHSGLSFATTAGADPAAEALQASVYRTGLLPYLLIGDNGALDISAIGRTESGSYPSDALCWQDAGTDEMRAVRRPIRSPAAAGQNQPLADGHPAGRADYRAALLRGFRTSYDAICRHRAELLARTGFPTRWADSPGRLIVRATRFYATLLEESTHPDLLRDALARDTVFALLWTESKGDPARQRLIEDEIADLWCGDVPLFVHRPAQTVVWTARGAGLHGALCASSLATVLDKITAMSEVERYDQEWVIAATLAVSSAESHPGGPRSRLARGPASIALATPSRLLAAACGIADQIAARAVRGGGRANWIGMERVADRHWTVLPMGGGLAEGYCGVALFLAQIGRLARAERYTALAREAVRPLPLLLSCMADDPEVSAAVGPGALSGLGGIVYTLVRLSDLLDEGIDGCLPDALSALTHAAHALIAGPPDDPSDGAVLAGLAHGLAGALVAALLMHETSGADDAAALARRLADRLQSLVGDGTGAPGFAGGDAGIGWALLRYARTAAFAADAQPHAAAGTTLLRSALDTALGARDLSWSSGLSGVLVAAADALGPADRWTPQSELDRCIRLLAAPEPAADLSLHQGAAGALEPLLALAARGHLAAREALDRRAGSLLGLIEQEGPLCGTPDRVPTPGLLTGLSGIGYALLRLAFPETVPSIALLDRAGKTPGGPSGTVRNSGAPRRNTR